MSNDNAATVASDLLRRSGEALWGLHWQTEMSRALNVSDRHIRRMASGVSAVPAGFLGDLVAVADRRRREIEAVSILLAAAVTATGEI